jgi:hypothetical protein
MNDPLDPGPIQPDDDSAGGPVQRSIDNAACVMRLREALARAEAGGTIAVAVAEVRTGGEVAHSYETGWSWAPLVGALTMLLHRITRMAST